MTPPSPTEVAALRERLADALIRRSFDLCHVTRADIRAALALLDAQAAEIARLTAERDAARADVQEMYDRWAGAIRNLTESDHPAPAPAEEAPDA